MKKIVLFSIMLALVLTMAACGCKHETWNAADCVTPKTCAECGEIEGEALGHTWVDADCVTPKTCSVCKQTEGTALGHDWAEADCENPKTCKACKLTEGEALGHDWADATTEAPKTCTRCEKTEGERIVTDPRFTTANNQQLFGVWKAEMTETVPEYDFVLTMYTYMEFNNDGTMKIKIEVKDSEAFRDAILQATVDATYAEMAAAGYNKESADQQFKAAYGMGVEDYMREVIASMDMNELMGITDAISYVYYAEGDKIYSGISWNLELTEETYKLEDGVLYLSQGDSTEPMAFTRVE